jgi:hypothetical protein
MREGLLLRRRAQLGTPLPVLLVHLPCHRRRGPAGTHPPNARHAASGTQPRVARDTHGASHTARSTQRIAYEVPTGRVPRAT